MEIFRKIYWIFGLTGLLGFAMAMAVLGQPPSFSPVLVGGFGIILSALPWVVIAPKGKGNSQT